jgi:hypothetical protein
MTLKIVYVYSKYTATKQELKPKRFILVVDVKMHVHETQYDSLQIHVNYLIFSFL